jgi:hypothetical protein
MPGRHRTSSAVACGFNTVSEYDQRRGEQPAIRLWLKPACQWLVHRLAYNLLVGPLEPRRRDRGRETSTGSVGWRHLKLVLQRPVASQERCKQLGTQAPA